ncbi:SapC family protein [Sphingomonas faeni]|uniref:SapC family protein n=1 Tax=Sphingomonas faeni TaxID=185950 RepID=UPI00335F0DB8
MSRVRALNRAEHATLRFDRTVVGASQRIVQIGLSELALAAADMPLCLAKDANTGRFNLVALVGLVEPINLFVHDRRFHATYCPRALQLSAFRLDQNGVAGLAVAEDDPAIGASGDALFHDGEPSPLLTGVAAALETLVTDIGAARDLVDGYAANHLVRPLDLVLQGDDGRDHAIEGLYTIGKEALMRLPDADVVRLHRSGALASAALLTASLAQVERLCQLHNAAGRQPLRITRLSHDDGLSAF